MIRSLVALLLGPFLPVVAGAVVGALIGDAIGDWRWPDRSGAWTLAGACVGALIGALGLLALRTRSVLHGSGRFRSGGPEFEPLTRETGLIVGRHGKRGRLLRYDGPAHLMTVAPTRAGKGVSVIVPNLLTMDRPAVVIDPKGENYRVTARARAEFGPVLALDPFRVTGASSKAYNPMHAIDVDGNRFAEDAASLAEAIVADPTGDRDAAHWNGEARALISGLVLHCAASDDPGKRNLAEVRDCLTRSPEATRKLLAEMQASDRASGLVARAANRRLQQNEREAASILSTAQRHTHFLDSSLISESVLRSDFSYRDVVRRNGTVYLILPPDRIRTYSRWLRILVSRAISELTRDTGGSKRLLLLLDECAALGRLRPLEDALGIAAGYGMQIWTVFQDLHQMHGMYGRGAETFLSNAGIVQAFNVNDLPTAQTLSSTLGARTVSQPSSGLRSRTGRSLLTPDEILSLPPDRMLVLPQHGRPVLAHKPCYYEDEEFAGKYDPPS